MVGRQIGIVVGDIHKLDYYKRIYEILHERVISIMNKYDLDEVPVTISILYKNVEVENISKIKTIQKVENINTVIFKPSKIQNFIKYLPLTAYISEIGNLLQGFVRTHYVKKLIKNIINLSGVKLPDLLVNIESKTDIKVLLKKQGKLEKYLIFVEKNVSDNKLEYKKNIYDISSGLLLEEIYDTVFDVANLNYFKRRTKDMTIIVKDEKIISLERKIKFDVIRNRIFSMEYDEISNKRFGVLDVETYKDGGLGKVYAIGFVTLLDKSDLNIFYLTDLDNSLDSNKLILECVNSMLKSKYHNYIFYVHNLGKFDVVFIQKALEEYNLYRREKLNESEDYYKLTSLFRDDKILRLSVSIKISIKKYIKISFVDSLNLLNNKLEDLCKDFQVSTTKGIFPYEFVTKKTLNYIGQQPAKSHYNNISEEEYYCLIASDSWDLKKETIKYLEKDLLGLLEVLNKFSSLLFIEHDLQMLEGLTISRIALNKFLKFYLKDFEIPLINKSQYFNFIYFGYYGGITEIYKPFGENLKYYDVNSLYPYVALQDMPGIDCSYIENFSNEDIDINELFGFFQAKVKTTYNSYLGLLPIKTKAGLILPNGEFEGI
jgi:hypothetical protein